VAQIAEIEVYGCDITDAELPSHTQEPSSANGAGGEKASTHVSDQGSYSTKERELTIPGKPSVTFIE
jgi:hypothetical protein